ncbi:hypothetical protein ABZ614_11435 [Streptomyces sp. NPDC013178]|uniref:hypothetical protein n=1 Tax=Streptomyces sp. NPDC013178 TaxID=3155118 RepID=UPI0033DF72F8
MPGDTQQRPHLADLITALSAEATLLTARVETLREELATVNERIASLGDLRRYLDDAVRPSVSPSGSRPLRRHRRCTNDR